MLSLVTQMNEGRVITRDVLKLPKHPLIHLKYEEMILKSKDHKEKLQAPCCSNFQKGNDHLP